MMFLYCCYISYLATSYGLKEKCMLISLNTLLYRYHSTVYSFYHAASYMLKQCTQISFHVQPLILPQCYIMKGYSLSRGDISVDISLNVN